jgi:PKD repeat protein
VILGLALSHYGASVAGAALSVPLVIKESGGYPATNWPVTVVVPLPYGVYTNTSAMVVRDAGGAAVPAQFEVLNRWVGRDASIRHVAAHFQASVGPYTGPGTGTNVYSLCDNGPGMFATTLCVSNQTDEVVVQTGPLKFTVDKRHFNILDEVFLDANSNGVFEAGERMMSNSTNDGAILVTWQGQVRRDAWRTNITVVVEESGPVRAVIKVFSPTHFVSTNDHTHGFAARIYAWAGQPYIKVDYQLQNGALNTDLSWPLYFDSWGLNFNLAVTGAAEVAIGLGTNGIWQSVTNSVALRQTFHNTGHVVGASSAPIQTFDQADGWMSLHQGGKAIGVFLRHFWQAWPHGLRYTNGLLRVELFPEWSCQFFATNNTGPKTFTSTGWYWLEDMQATFKEVLLHFHAAPLATNELRRIAAQMAYPPVPVIPLAWYRTTRATFDLDGYVPPGTPTDSDTSRLPAYYAPDWIPEGDYRFGWDNYYLDEPIRKYGTATTGGWPGSAGSRFLAVGNPAFYHDAERKALAELNVRPHWIPGYDHDRDFDRLRLTTAPYAGQSWRRFDGHGYPWLAAPYLAGTALDACPRDDQHGWYQHMRDWYHLSANLWVRDWYEFVAQFRHTSLLRTSPYEELAGRARGHALAHALAAYRSTGNPDILDHFATEVRALRADQFQHGGRYDADKAGGPSGASWQAGYVGRAVLDYMFEIQGSRSREWAEAFNFIAGLVDWNKNHANFSYYLNAFTETNVPSSSTGLIMVDLQAWYALATGDSNAMRQTFLYVTNGILGGEMPAGDFASWTGQYEARQWLALTNAVAAGRAFIAPPPIPVFTATAETGRVTFRWQGMPGGRRYHFCWSDKEISLAHTLNTNYINWWAAETTLTNVATAGGENLELSVASSLPAGTPLSACVFYFDSNHNMSVKTEIVRPPQADFAGAPLRGAAPLTVMFTNQTLRQITSSRWAFGDGAVSNTLHATHTYSTAGDYTVSLTVSNAAGSNTLARSAYVHVVPPGMPIADFGWSTNRGPAPLTVQFTNLSLGVILTNAWAFGDGSTATAVNPQHTFATAGVYTVTLVAYSAAGSDTCRVASCIAALPPPPMAQFSAFPVSGGYPLAVQFTNLTAGVATNWAWTFGDGGSSVARDPQHLYAATGAYTVALTATGPGGSHTETKAAYIAVLPEQGDDYRPAAGHDDANQEHAAVTVGESFIYLGYSRDMLAGFRFPGVHLPASSVVTRAYIQFASTSGRSDPAFAIIRAQKSASPAPFAAAASNLSARPVTDAFVEWTIPAWEYNGQGEAQRTPDLAPIIREVVSGPAWTNGSALAFLLASSGNYGEQGMRHAWSYEYAASENRLERAARLHIEYQTNVNVSGFAFRATALTNSVMLRWTDPARCGLAGWHALVRAATNGYPAAPTSGAFVVSTTNAWYYETGLENNVTRYYTIWLSFDGTNWVAPNDSIITK